MTRLPAHFFQVRVDIPCNDKINASCQAKSESITTNTSLVIRQKAKVKVFSNKPEEEKFFQKQQALLSEHGYNISCSAEGFEINRTSASLYFRPCISYNACQVICETECHNIWERLRSPGGAQPQAEIGARSGGWGDREPLPLQLHWRPFNLGGCLFNYCLCSIIHL